MTTVISQGPTVTSQGPTVTMAGVKEHRALGCPLSGEHFPQEAASPLELLAALQHKVSQAAMEKHCKHGSSRMHQGLPSMDWMHRLMEAAGGTGWWWDEAAWSYLGTGAGLAGTVRDAVPWQLPPSHCSPSSCSCFPRGRTFLNLGQPLPTGLQELEAFSSTQKVLWWLESHVPSHPGSLAKEDEDWGTKVGKEQTQEILEEDVTRPVPSVRRQDRSQKQESQATAKEDSGQEGFQGQEDEKAAARGEGISKLHSTSPALAASMDTKDKTAMSPSGAGACLLPSEAPGDRSPSLPATPGPQQPQPQSLFRRALRAVRRAFLGTCRPRRRQQQCPAASARQVPGDGCSEPQQCP
ncbi:hypothetical protein DUI87_11219 [Hirundo rustica rustica]|uniref:Uncharacterized protein n=1 Tax=Hirundo rustica rustica TaxID=333673 RepID=A0A3M0KLJ4_HIRRU|nr:hypothetical protein DUI87_11219 [Hirundo rustica rustica]